MPNISCAPLMESMMIRVKTIASLTLPYKGQLALTYRRDQGIARYALLHFKANQLNRRGVYLDKEDALNAFNALTRSWINES
jgi:hypothetical protein